VRLAEAEDNEEKKKKIFELVKAVLHSLDEPTSSIWREKGSIMTHSTTMKACLSDRRLDGGLI
jgi:hypothetical protein